MPESTPGGGEPRCKCVCPFVPPMPVGWSAVLRPGARAAPAEVGHGECLWPEN